MLLLSNCASCHLFKLWATWKETEKKNHLEARSLEPREDDYGFVGFMVIMKCVSPSFLTCRSQEFFFKKWDKKSLVLLFVSEIQESFQLWYQGSTSSSFGIVSMYSFRYWPLEKRRSKSNQCTRRRCRKSQTIKHGYQILDARRKESRKISIKYLCESRFLYSCNWR